MLLFLGSLLCCGNMLAVAEEEGGATEVAEPTVARIRTECSRARVLPNAVGQGSDAFELPRWRVEAEHSVRGNCHRNEYFAVW